MIKINREFAGYSSVAWVTSASGTLRSGAWPAANVVVTNCDFRVLERQPPSRNCCNSRSAEDKLDELPRSVLATGGVRRAHRPAGGPRGR